MLSIVLVALVPACASPSPDFLGAPRQDAEIDGTRFAIYRRGNEAQVIRLDHLARAERAAMPERMVRAVASATGCTAVARSWRPVGGRDSAVARVNLHCR